MSPEQRDTAKQTNSTFSTFFLNVVLYTKRTLHRKVVGLVGGGTGEAIVSR